MSDTAQNIQAQYAEQVDPMPSEPAAEVQTISPRRRFALVTYLSFLFAVSFLFVALTLAAETKRLKSINEDLQDNNQRVSASLDITISALQEENHQLQQSIADLEEERQELSTQLESLQASSDKNEEEIASMVEQISALTVEKAELEEAKSILKAQIDTLTKQAKDAVTVSELLQKAVSLNRSGDAAALENTLNQIEALKDLLSPSEQEIYNSLSGNP